MPTKHFLQRLLQIVVFVFAFSPVLVLGHSPSLSGIYLTENEKGKWVLQIRSSLTAFEYEIQKRFPEKSYKTADEFKKLVSTHIKESALISFNDKVVELNTPKIQLGHEGVVAFEINAPDEISTISVKNTSFENVYKSRSVLIFTGKDKARERVILDESNEFSTSFDIE